MYGSRTYEFHMLWEKCFMRPFYETFTMAEHLYSLNWDKIQGVSDTCILTLTWVGNFHPGRTFILSKLRENTRCFGCMHPYTHMNGVCMGLAHEFHMLWEKCFMRPFYETFTMAKHLYSLNWEKIQSVRMHASEIPYATS